MTKEDLNEIRKTIKSFKENEWKNIFSTNNYAYALKIDIPEEKICKDNFEIGYLANLKKLGYEFTLNHFVMNFESDLAALDIDYKYTTMDSRLNSDEWKILVYLQKCKNSYNSAHFVRQDESGIWTHKNSVFSLPEEFSSDKIIKYDMIDCYKLKLKK